MNTLKIPEKSSISPKTSFFAAFTDFLPLITAIIFLFLLVFLPDISGKSVRMSLNTCYFALLPSLFPFMVCGEIIFSLGCGSLSFGFAGKVFEKFINLDTVFYESPNRLIETLENIKETRGEQAKVAVGRELTKVSEEVKAGSVTEIIDYYKTHTLKGEIVCMLYARENTEEQDSDIIEKIKKLKTLNYPDKDISAILSTLYGYKKNKVYKLALDL